MSEFPTTMKLYKRQGWCDSTRVREREADVFDLEVEAPCPQCGFELHDASNLDRMPSPGGWNTGTATARCEFCGARYQVRLEIVEAPPLSTR